MVFLSIPKIALCFVFSLVAMDTNGMQALVLHSYDMMSERTIPEDLILFVSRTVLTITESHADEIKGLKALIEAQGRQIKALEMDKLTSTAVTKKLERRIEHLETKMLETVAEAHRDDDVSFTPEADDTIIEEKFQKLVKQRDQSSSTSEIIIGHQNRIRRTGDGNKVAFFARLHAHAEHVAQDQLITFNDVVTNIGGAYNKSSGNFEAPTTGAYLFSITIGHQDGDDTSAKLVVNGTPVVKVIVSEEQSTQTVVVNLKAGDFVALQNAEIEREYTGDGYSSFSGFLLYEDFSVSQVVG